MHPYTSMHTSGCHSQADKLSWGYLVFLASPTLGCPAKTAQNAEFGEQNGWGDPSVHGLLLITAVRSGPHTSHTTRLVQMCQ